MSDNESWIALVMGDIVHFYEAGKYCSYNGVFYKDSSASAPSEDLEILVFL